MYGRRVHQAGSSVVLGSRKNLDGISRTAIRVCLDSPTPSHPRKGVPGLATGRYRFGESPTGSRS
jgi:hypothetical protein